MSVYSKVCFYLRNKYVALLEQIFWILIRVYKIIITEIILYLILIIRVVLYFILLTIRLAIMKLTFEFLYLQNGDEITAYTYAKGRN